MIVAVHQGVFLGNGFDQGAQLRRLLLRQMRRNEIRPIKRRFLHIGHFAVCHLDGVDALEHIHVILGGQGQILRILADQLGDAGGIQKLGDRAVPIAYTNDAVRNGSIDAQNECASCVFTLLLDLRQSVLGKIGLYDGFCIVSIHCAVGALGNKLTAVNAHSPVGFFNRDHIGKTGHIKNLVNIRRNIDDGQLGLFFSQS